MQRKNAIKRIIPQFVLSQTFSYKNIVLLRKRPQHQIYGEWALFYSQWSCYTDCPTLRERPSNQHKGFWAKFTLRSDWLQNVTDIHRDIFTPASLSAINSILNSDIYIPQSQDVHIDAISWVFDQYVDIFCCNAMDRLILQRWKAQCHPLTFLQSFITGDTLECILCTWLWSNMLA